MLAVQAGGDDADPVVAGRIAVGRMLMQRFPETVPIKDKQGMNAVRIVFLIIQYLRRRTSTAHVEYLTNQTRHITAPPPSKPRHHRSHPSPAQHSRTNTAIHIHSPASTTNTNKNNINNLTNLHNHCHLYRKHPPSNPPPRQRRQHAPPPRQRLRPPQSRAPPRPRRRRSSSTQRANVDAA